MIEQRHRRVKDPTTALYYDAVSKEEILDAKTEHDLFVRYKKTGDPEARDRIVGSALRFVIKLARKYARDEEVTKDLVSAGNVGLLKALDRYKLDRGTRFLSYATSWILLEMRNELYNARLVSLPLWRQKAIHKTRQVNARAEAKNGSRASVDALSYETELSSAQLNRLYDRSYVKIISIFEPRKTASADPYDNTACLLNVLADSASRVDCQAIDDETRALLHTCISKLPTVTEQFVIKAYFGWMSDPWSLRQIGNVLLVTSERVRQIKVVALRKLRKHLRLHYRVKKVGDVCLA
jgi:RNA polymerase primary sigma factor